MAFFRNLFRRLLPPPPGGGSSASIPVRKGRTRDWAGAWETGNPSQVAALGLPEIRDLNHLAQLVNLAPGKLKWLAGRFDRADLHYVERRIPKRSGGERLLHCPKPLARRAQQWILQNVLQKVRPADAAHGFVRGRSIVTNATPHCRRTVVVSADLVDFFPTISVASVQGVFLWMGYAGEVARTLARLCTCRRTARAHRILPQGAPTSPAITNLVCWSLDRRAEGLARKFGATYTRYADDLTFSGDKELKNGLKRFLPLLMRIVRDEGFRVNRRKLRFARKGRRQVVTGLVVNARPSVSRETRRRLRAILHNCRAHGLDSQNAQNDPLFLDRLRGQVAFVSQINPDHGAKLKAALEDIAPRR